MPRIEGFARTIAGVIPLSSAVAESTGGLRPILTRLRILESRQRLEGVDVHRSYARGARIPYLNRDALDLPSIRRVQQEGIRSGQVRRYAHAATESSNDGSRRKREGAAIRCRENGQRFTVPGRRREVSIERLAQIGGETRGAGTVELRDHVAAEAVIDERRRRPRNTLPLPMILEIQVLLIRAVGKRDNAERQLLLSRAYQLGFPFAGPFRSYVSRALGKLAVRYTG